MNRRRLIQSLVALPCAGVANVAELPEPPWWANMWREKPFDFKISLACASEDQQIVNLWPDFDFEHLDCWLEGNVKDILQHMKSVQVSMTSVFYPKFLKWMNDVLPNAAHSATFYKGCTLVRVFPKTA